MHCRLVGKACVILGNPWRTPKIRGDGFRITCSKLGSGRREARRQVRQIYCFTNRPEVCKSFARMKPDRCPRVFVLEKRQHVMHLLPTEPVGITDAILSKPSGLATNLTRLSAWISSANSVLLFFCILNLVRIVVTGNEANVLCKSWQNAYLYAAQGKKV